MVFVGGGLVWQSETQQIIVVACSHNSFPSKSRTIDSVQLRTKVVGDGETDRFFDRTRRVGHIK